MRFGLSGRGERIIFPSLSMVRQPHLQAFDTGCIFFQDREQDGCSQSICYLPFFADEGDALTFLWRETVFGVENME